MSIRRKTFSAGRWTITSSAVRTLLQVVQLSILARLLLPADFGLMAIAASALAVTGLFADLGLSRAIIHFEHIPETALSTLYWLNLITGAILTMLFVVMAPVLAHAYRRPELLWVLFGLSPYFILNAAGQQFFALAEKDLRFGTLAGNEIAATFFGSGVAVVAAWSGAGVYALVAAMLTTSGMNALLAWMRLSAGHRPGFHFDLAESRRFLSYGGYLITDSLANTLLRQADIFVGGAMVSSAALGTYALPRDLGLKISSVINPIITRVGFPVMSRLQRDTTSLASVYSMTLLLTASINCPAYVALALYAREIVTLLYGQQWLDAVVYLRILAAWGMLRSMANPVGSLLYAVGKARLALIWNLCLLAILPLIYWGVARIGGLQGLAYSMSACQLLLLIPAWAFLVRPSCAMLFTEYARQLMLPLALALLAGFAAWLATHHVPHGTLRIALGGLTGGLAYLVLSWFFNRTWIDAMLELVLYKRQPR